LASDGAVTVTSEPSSKFQLHELIIPFGVEERSVKRTAVPEHDKEVEVKIAIGAVVTCTWRVLTLVQPF